MTNIADMPGLTGLLEEQETLKNELLDRPFRNLDHYFQWRNRVVKYALGEMPKDGDITMSWIFYAPLIETEPRHNRQSWKVTAIQFSAFLERIFDRSVREMRGRFAEDRDQRQGTR